jgi:hypothetical protein
MQINAWRVEMRLNTPNPDSTDYVVGVLQFCEWALSAQQPDLANMIGYAAIELRKRRGIDARSMRDGLESTNVIRSGSAR